MSYATVAQAISAASSGDTVQLLKNITVSAPIAVNKNITVDGGGHTVTNSGSKTAAFSVTGSACIKNVTINSTAGSGIYVSASSVLTVEDSTINAVGNADNTNPIHPSAGATINIKNTNMKGSHYIILGKDNLTVNIYGGNIETTADSADVRMFQMTNANSKWNFYGGNFTAKRGYVFNGANNSQINVYGGNYYFEASKENLFNVRDTVKLNFYGGYFYTPNHTSPIYARGTATINVYGGTYISSSEAITRGENGTANTTECISSLFRFIVTVFIILRNLILNAGK